MSERSGMSDISSELTTVFRDVFEDDSLEIGRETSARDVAGWDSLMHVTLILQVERRFGVRFSSAEVAMLRNAGELQDLIDARREAR
jgi:acyl carrier protein